MLRNAKINGREEEEMETEREEEKEKEIEGRGRQERGRIDKMIDLQGQRHRKVPLDSDRSGSLQSSVSLECERCLLRHAALDVYAAKRDGTCSFEHVSR